MNDPGPKLGDLAALKLQLEWGVDEAMLDHPLARYAAAPPPAAPPPAAPPAAPVSATPPVPAALAAATPAAAARAAAAASDLPALHAAMDGFASPLRQTASTTVAPSGNPAAGLVLVGEAPGPDDDRAGLAFAGAPGERIDRVLASAGLGRHALLLALVVPWRPPGGRPVSEAEFALCLPFLHRLLALARPRRLVLMGAGPHRALAAEPGPFRKARGRWSTVAPPGLPPLPALTMLAPDAWLTTPANRQTTWSDLLTLRDTLSDDV